MNRKFIIIYSECLRSKILYQKFIEKNSNNIKAVIKIPNYPSNKDKINFKLFKKIFLSSFSYKLFIFLQVTLYNILKPTFLSLEKISKDKDILFLEIKSLDNTNFLKNIPNFQSTDIIFHNTMHKLNLNFLSLKNIILNLHEAPLPSYKGSALYYHLKIASEKK